MNDPAASGQGIKTALFAERGSSLQDSNTSPQGAGNSTRERLSPKALLILKTLWGLWIDYS
jgi:hypothetical protein